ncbi:serine/threonine protein kinase [Paraliomyxa miuraensis]|uniref:serine/threonine protein kinase n=1 Tax=Paraliomyxa miuraensis TaxID=376150 RepID=UPI002259C695|nr:serine/threonine-protein kinase [Paraliomyxa miuraensis]MCX4241655.1 protein kinase [Paraliomyxa miuraensis]
MRSPVLNQRERAEIPAGTRFGRYTIIRRLAMGGMAEVYLGRAEGIRGFRRAVALKLVLPHLAGDERFIALFEHEAKIAALLDHPNIIQIYELGRERGDTYIAMEYVHGHTLRTVLGRAHGPLPLSAALTIVMAICRALHHAHTALGPDGCRMGIVHRDVSPSNVMIRPDGQVKVVDFGIAKAMAQTSMTATGTVKGKAGYMSPEQCRGSKLDHRSDIFNLGILLYETTTGRRAFGGTNVFEVMSRINDGRYMPPSEVVPGYPAALEGVIAQALCTDPTGRPASALELHQRIEEVARACSIHLSELELAAWMEAHVPAPAPLDLDVEPVTEESTRVRRWGWASRVGLVGVLSVIAGAYGLSALATHDDEPASDPLPDPLPTANDATPQSSPTPVVQAGAPEPAGPTERVDAPETVERDASTEPAKASSAADAASSAAPAAARSKGSKRKSRRGASKPPADAKREPLFPWMEGG